MAKESQRRARKKWNDEHMKERYDRLQLITPKGCGAVVKAFAEMSDVSANEYMKRALFDKIGVYSWDAARILAEQNGYTFPEPVTEVAPDPVQDPGAVDLQTLPGDDESGAGAGDGVGVEE